MIDSHEWIEVDKIKFVDEFIPKYPRELTFDSCGISEPPTISYNDFSFGVWPHSIVASTHREKDTVSVRKDLWESIIND